MSFNRFYKDQKKQSNLTEDTRIFFRQKYDLEKLISTYETLLDNIKDTLKQLRSNEFESDLKDMKGEEGAYVLGWFQTLKKNVTYLAELKSDFPNRSKDYEEQEQAYEIAKRDCEKEIGPENFAMLIRFVEVKQEQLTLEGCAERYVTKLVELNKAYEALLIAALDKDLLSKPEYDALKNEEAKSRVRTNINRRNINS